MKFCKKIISKDFVVENWFIPLILDHICQIRWSFLKFCKKYDLKMSFCQILISTTYIRPFLSDKKDFLKFYKKILSKDIVVKNWFVPLIYNHICQIIWRSLKFCKRIILKYFIVKIWFVPLVLEHICQIRWIFLKCWKKYD